MKKSKLGKGIEKVFDEEIKNHPLKKIFKKESKRIREEERSRDFESYYKSGDNGKEAGFRRGMTIAAIIIVAIAGMYLLISYL